MRVIILSILCIVLAVVALFVPLFCPNLLPWSLGASTTFATLAGAFLVYKTLETQRKSLDEERNKNAIEKFNTMFHPLHSAFRDAALQFTFYEDFLEIQESSCECSRVLKGEEAFEAANRMLCSLFGSLKDDAVGLFEYNSFKVNQEYTKQLDELRAFPYVDDSTITKQYERIKGWLSAQTPGFLCSKYNITADDYNRLKGEQDDIVTEFLLGKMEERQDNSYKKYFHILNHLLKQVADSKEIHDKSNYYNHIRSFLGSAESQFIAQIKLYQCLT